MSKRLYFRDKTTVLRFCQDQINWHVPGNPYEIEKMVVECAFGKLCGAMGVSVQVGSPDHPFDLVCYDNYIEFFMEQGARLTTLNQLEIEAVSERLKYCVAVVHHFGIIHKDIKPENFLINSEGEVVLADFGISAFTLSKPGESTLTYREGTIQYMSPEMISIDYLGKGYVDLYCNDMHALKKSLEQLGCTSLQIKAETLGTSCQVLEEDRIIHELGYFVGTAQRKAEVKASTATMKKFYSYFSELGCEVAEENFVTELLVRGFGVSPKLIFYLQQVPRPTQ